MTRYEQAAVEAVKLINVGTIVDPHNAWTQATINIFGRGKSSQVKGCPRGAFLGLCEAGLVKGVPAGTYTRASKNKKYAVDAVAALKVNSALASDKQALWKAVLRGKTKSHNEQLDVVIALWNSGLIE